jgi:ATP-dependent metalloprotease
LQVKYLGMSDRVGLRVQHGDSRDRDLSPAAKEMTDDEIKLLLDDSYKRASSLLVKHRKELELLAENLLK